MSKLKNIIFLVLFLSVVSNISNAQTPKRSVLDGVFYAPKGTTVVSQKDGKDELSLTASSNGTADFSSNPFKFPNLYVDGTPCTLAIKSAPAGQTCKVEKGERGTIGLK